MASVTMIRSTLPPFSLALSLAVAFVISSREQVAHRSRARARGRPVVHYLH